MEFKFSWNHVASISWHVALLFLIINVGAFILIEIHDAPEAIKPVSIVLVCSNGYFILPYIVFAFRFMLNDRNQCVIFDGAKIKIIKDGKLNNYHVDDVSKVQLCLTNNRYNDGVWLVPDEALSYVKIEFNDSKSIIITCFSGDISRITHKKFEKKKVLFPYFKST
jgi:hypothetical protein